VGKYGTDRQTTDESIIRRMRFACWITKPTDTHSEYVIFIAFPPHQWSRERASMLRDTTLPLLFYFSQCVSRSNTGCVATKLRNKWLLKETALA
jgi:hypothetical protein